MIPNLLFLWGWYTPCVAAAASVLMLFAVSRTVWLQCERSAKVFSWEGKRFGVSVLVLLLVFLLLIFRLAQGGIIGLWPAHSDYFWLRQAQFLNIRDAAWPVVLPDGREMSYYLANFLPCAALARILPEWASQWCILAWNSAAVFMSILLFSSPASFFSERP